MTNLYIIIALLLFVAVIYSFWRLQKKHVKFSTRVFIALGSGIVFGALLQLLFGATGDVTTGAIEWINIVGTGDVRFLQMLIMPLIFVSIVGAFTKIEGTKDLGKI
ncbi:cation:dicarboxylate symporter family transporter, partial [Carnobacterium sp.]|uniref:cation:dicarboxylate symporter family transporter n=1 Tax=Carnobacterium sp. TaxID=48221 RepID=UPI0028AF466E